MAFVTVMGIIILKTPFRNTVAARTKKLCDNPLREPVIPTRKQDTISMSFTPNRSLTTPPNKLTKIPARFDIPQMVPICTRVRLKSSVISLKRGGMQEKGMVTTKAEVITDSASMYQRYVNG